MKQTNLSVELVYITPVLAKNYLRYNTKNRKHSNRHVSFLENQMNNNLFIENGETIVFDINGNLMDGQHRLKAIVKSGKSYYIPIIRGAVTNSMATYDTGKNRSASDVLTLNGYQNCNVLASLIKNIYQYIEKNKKIGSYFSTNRSDSLTNQQVLDFCELNYDWLNVIITNTNAIYQKSKTKVISPSGICLITYLIGGKNPSDDVYEFIKHLIGVSVQDSTATSYLFTKLYNAKVNKEPLNFYWILGMSIKAFNYYADGNPSVKYFKFKVNQDLPKVLVNVYN